MSEEKCVGESAKPEHQKDAKFLMKKNKDVHVMNFIRHIFLSEWPEFRVLKFFAYEYVSVYFPVYVWLAKLFVGWPSDGGLLDEHPSVGDWNLKLSNWQSSY